jgi:hypothetical protein
MLGKPMMLSMAAFAFPAHHKGLSVIVMVHLSFERATIFTVLTSDAALLQRISGLSTCSFFQPFLRVLVIRPRPFKES